MAAMNSVLVTDGRLEAQLLLNKVLRPFGAALGDLLTQQQTNGGLELGATWTSALFLIVIALLVAIAQVSDGTRQIRTT